MLSENLRVLLKPYQFLLKMVWVGMTLPILLYVGIVYSIFASAGEPGPEPSHETLEFVFGLVAVSLGIASILWLRSHLSDERLKAKLAHEVNPRTLATNRKTAQVDGGRLLEIESLSEIEQKLLSLASGYHLPFFVPFALNMAIATLGVVLAFLTVNPSKMFPFALAAIVLNVLMFPRFNALLNRASLLVPREMPEGIPAQVVKAPIGRMTMDSGDRLTTGAIIFLVGSVACIVAILIEGRTGVVLAFVGVCLYAVGSIMHWRERARGGGK